MLASRHAVSRVSGGRRAPHAVATAPAGRGVRGPAPARYAERAAAEEAEEQQILLPLDPTQLLGLEGRDSYHMCDVMDVYEALRSDAPSEGFSTAVLDGRLEVLEIVKDEAVYQNGRVALADKGGTTIPVHLLPSALVLLMQIGAHDMVISMALPLMENWEVRKAYKRDILLALALAYCSQARDYLAAEQTVEGCLALEEALRLLQSAGSPPLAPPVASDIDAALRGLAVPRVLDQLRAPAAPEGAAARKRAVELLRGILASPAAYVPVGPDGGKGQPVNADYVKLVVGSMGAREIVDMADWRAAARNPRGTFWVYPGLLQIAAHAHAAVGFSDRDPSLVQTGAALLRAAPGAASAEALVARAACAVLMGATDDALAQLQAARKAQQDVLLPWPSGAVLAPAVDDDVLTATGMPLAQEAHAFVCAHSRHDDAGDLLPGLCVLTELWLARVAYAMFPDTAGEAPSSLGAYFNNARVQQQLERAEAAAMPAAAAGAVAGAFGAVVGGVTGGLAAVRAALTGAPKAAAAVLERGGGGGEAGAPGSRSWRDGGAAPGALRQQDWDDDAAGGLPEQWPPGVLSRGGGAGGLDMGVSPLDAPTAAGRAGGAPAAWEHEDALDAAGHAPAPQREADADPWMRPRGASAAAVRGADAGAAPAQGMLPAALQRAAALVGPKGAAAAAGAAALALALALQPRGPAAPSAYHQQAAGIAAAQPGASVFDAAAAARLVRAYQESRWRALGPDWDTSGLEAVASDQALAHLRAQSDQYASRGWFQRFRLHGAAVTAVAPAGAGTARVEAAVRETSSMFGVDGRRAESVASEYGVVYRVKAGADGRWRITNFKVVGKEPRGALARLFGGGR